MSKHQQQSHGGSRDLPRKIGEKDAETQRLETHEPKFCPPETAACTLLRRKTRSLLCWTPSLRRYPTTRQKKTENGLPNSPSLTAEPSCASYPPTPNWTTFMPALQAPVAIYVDTKNMKNETGCATSAAHSAVHMYHLLTSVSLNNNAQQDQPPCPPEPHL